MSEKPLATTREALMAELLIDVDRLLNKVSDLDRTLGETIEKSTKEATNKGFLAASLQIRKLIEDLEFKMHEATTLVQKLHAPSSTSSRTLRSTQPLQQPALHFVMGFLGAIVGACLIQILH